MDSDEDYNPEEDEDIVQDDVDEDDAQVDDIEEEVDDEAKYLTQRIGGYEGVSDEGTDDAGTEDEAGPQFLFDDAMDPLTLLEGMGRPQEGDGASQQPYEVLARSQRARNHSNDAATAAEGNRLVQQADARHGLFGATVEDIWNEDIAEKVGMLGDKQRSRKKQREKERRRRRAAAKGIRSKELPEEVTRRLGEANLFYATNRYEEAIRLLLEVIKLAPNLPDPYHTLGLLHEASNNSRKALDFYMIAVHLTPRDVSLWRRLAALSTDLGFLRQAIYCLSKVIARDKEDLDARWDRAVLYAEINEPSKALAAFETIAAARQGDGEVVKMLARLYHRMGMGQKAIEVLEAHTTTYPEAADLTDVNILAELYIEGEQYERAAALIRHAEQRLCMESGLPIDLTVKAGMCAMHLGDMPTALEMFDALHEESPSDYADLYMDVGDLLATHREYERALNLFEKLREQPEYNTPELWRRMTACQQAMGNDKGAVDMYRNILDNATMGSEMQVEAAMALAELYDEIGQSAAALEVLHGLQGISSLNLTGSQTGANALLDRRAHLLLRLGQQEAFLDLMLPVLNRTLRHFDMHSAPSVGSNRLSAALRRRLRLLNKNRGAHEQGVVFKGFVTRDRRKPHVREADELAAQLEAGALSESEAEDETGAAAAPGGGANGVVLDGLVSERQQFQMLVRTVRVLVRTGRASEAQQLTEHVNSLLSQRGAHNRGKKDVLRLVLAEAALAQGNAAAAHGLIRVVAAHWPYSPAVWNVYARVAAALGGLRHNLKSLVPLRHKHPTCLPLALLTAHSHALTGGYAAALNEYFHAYRQARGEPLTLLCIAVTMLNQVMSKKVADRDSAVLQIFAFLQEYAGSRRNQQEAAYNIGRAAHQLGLLHLAAPFYERALATEPPADPSCGPGMAAGAAISSIDIRREAAHNLVLIYRTTGAVTLARKVMRQHLVI